MTLALITREPSGIGGARFNESFAGLRSKGYDETFKRLWDYYLCYCEGGFLERSISVVHVVASRPGNRQR